MTVRRLAGLLLFALLLENEVSALDLPAAVGRSILRVDVENRSVVPTSEILRLFQLGPGDRYRPEAVQRSLELLGQKVGIRNVEVTATEEGGGLVLRLGVAPEPLVRSIRFAGNRHVKRKELLARVKLRVDRPAYAPFLEEDARTIRSLYAEQGFPSASVELRVENTSSPFWVKVVYRVDEGEPTRIDRVELLGGGPMPRERVLALVGLDQGDVASVRQLRDGVRRLLAAYHREDYPEARAPLARFERRQGETVLLLPVLTGSPVDVRFEGQGEWAARSLRELLEARYGETVDAAWAAQLAAAMTENLTARGYRKAAVSGHFSEENGAKRVTFQIDTESVARADKVTFEGNATIGSNQLERYLSIVHGGIVRRPPLTQEALDQDVRTLADYYASQGFLDARIVLSEVEAEPSGPAHVKIRIEEGTRYVVGELSIFGTGLEEAEARRMVGLAPGAVADAAEAENARVRLLAEVIKSGHPEAQVTYELKRHPETGVVDLEYRIVPGPLVRFGKTVVSGNARTRTKVIERELTFREGEPWNAQQVLLSRQKLFRLGFFQKVSIEPLGEKYNGGVRDVRVEVEEQDAGSFSLGGGYGSEEGIRGFAELGHSNLGGTGRDVRLRAQWQADDRSYSLSFREPWLFDYRLDLGLRLIRQTVDLPAFNNSLTALQASLDRRLSERIRASLLYTLEGNRLTDVVEAEAVESINNYVLSSVGPLLVWDSRDDPFNPTRGFQHTLQAEWALEAIGSEVQYGRYTGSMSGFFTWRGSTLALLARGGFADNLGRTAELPANKRFYLGGRTTVRGFDVDSIGPKNEAGEAVGGDAMLNLKAELRVPLWRQLGGALFWDAGNVWNRQVERVDFWNLRNSVGVGLRYITPIGPIAFDVARNLAPGSGERRYMWHFTIGSGF